MYKKTNDWMLTIASFNVGPARIQREVKKNKNLGKQTDFWSLKLPKETSKYLPRLLALLEVIKNPQNYNVDFPFLPNRPYFRVIDIPSQVDLMQVANKRQRRDDGDQLGRVQQPAGRRAEPGAAEGAYFVQCKIRDGHAPDEKPNTVNRIEHC